MNAALIIFLCGVLRGGNIITVTHIGRLPLLSGLGHITDGRTQILADQPVALLGTVEPHLHQVSDDITQGLINGAGIILIQVHGHKCAAYAVGIFMCHDIHAVTEGLGRVEGEYLVSEDL